MYFHLEVIIDDETGACLRCVWEGRGNAIGNFNKVAFEVSEFSYGENNASAREFLDARIDMIDVYEWDTEYMQAVGLTEIATHPGELYYSKWEDVNHCSRDSEAPYWEAQFYAYCDTATELEQELKAFARAFYDAGANLDYDGEEMSFDDYYWTDDDESCGFTGYTQDYVVELYFDYIGRAVNKHWRISVSIYAKY